MIEIDRVSQIFQTSGRQKHLALSEISLTIEDGAFVGHGVTFVNDKRPRATTADGGLQSADDWELEETVVEAGASIGSGATILGGVRIGRVAWLPGPCRPALCLAARRDGEQVHAGGGQRRPVRQAGAGGKAARCGRRRGQPCACRALERDVDVGGQPQCVSRPVDGDPGGDPDHGMRGIRCGMRGAGPSRR